MPINLSSADRALILAYLSRQATNSDKTDNKHE